MKDVNFKRVAQPLLKCVHLLKSIKMTVQTRYTNQLKLEKYTIESQFFFIYSNNYSTISFNYEERIT